MRGFLSALIVVGGLAGGCGGTGPDRSEDAAVDGAMQPDSGDSAAGVDAVTDRTSDADDAGDASDATAAMDVAMEAVDVPPPPAPMIVSFTATPSLLPAVGGLVTLEWAVRDATMLAIGGLGPVTGNTTTVMVTSSQTFVLTAGSAGGLDSKLVNVVVDSDAPSIARSSPANNARGVVAGSNIVVTFSEPMNRGKTQAAYSSTEIPAALAAFSWNDTGTVLTIDPTNDLVYGEGLSLDADARAYSITFLEGAEDLAGNELPRTALTFRTLRRLTLKLRRLAALDGWVDGGSAVLAADGTNIWVGDSSSDMATRGFLSYDIGLLPSALVSIDQAEAFAYQMTVVGGPYAALGGMIGVEHVTFETLTAAAFGSAPLRVLGVLSDGVTTGWKKVDVTVAVRDDFAQRDARGKRSQYRLSFPTATNVNGAVDRVELYDGLDAFEPYLNVVITTP